MYTRRTEGDPLFLENDTKTKPVFVTKEIHYEYTVPLRPN